MRLYTGGANIYQLLYINYLTGCLTETSEVLANKTISRGKFIINIWREFLPSCPYLNNGKTCYGGTNQEQVIANREYECNSYLKNN